MLQLVLLLLLGMVTSVSQTFNMNPADAGPIPDNGGASSRKWSTIDFTKFGTITKVQVYNKIQHTYQGDVTVSLHHGGPV